MKEALITISDDERIPLDCIGWKRADGTIALYRCAANDSAAEFTGVVLPPEPASSIWTKDCPHCSARFGVSGEFGADGKAKAVVKLARVLGAHIAEQHQDEGSERTP